MNDRLWEFCRNALKLINKYDLNPDYKNFSVLYLYFSGENKALHSEIEDKIKKNNLSDEICKTLYKKYVEKLDKKHFEEIYERFKDILIETLTNINNSNENIKNKNKKFDGYIEKIESKNIPIHEFSKILKNVVIELKDFRNDCDELSLTLNKSSDNIELLKKKIEELQKKAEIDPLTGLLNRRAFDSKINEIIKNEEFYPISLIFVDIDDFKQINDTYGHVIGDEVLRFIAKKLKDNSKNQDIIVRFGGEEFILLLPNTPLENAVKFANRLKDIISSKILVLKNSGKQIGKITASFGVSQYKKNEPITDFIDRADKALYFSKAHGKNQVNDERVLLNQAAS